MAFYLCLTLQAVAGLVPILVTPTHLGVQVEKATGFIGFFFFSVSALIIPIILMFFRPGKTRLGLYATLGWQVWILFCTVGAFIQLVVLTAGQSAHTMLLVGVFAVTSLSIICAAILKLWGEKKRTPEKPMQDNASTSNTQTPVTT